MTTLLHNRFFYKRNVCAALIITLLPTTVSAHTGISVAEGWVQGWIHPFTGLDHLSTMLAVGFLSIRAGRRPNVWLPISFLLSMLTGAILALSGVILAHAEAGIFGSVLLLGGVITLALRIPLLPLSLFVIATGTLHGYAHGAEAPGNASGMAYACGFLTATALLHLSGACVAFLLEKRGFSVALRYCGIALTLIGLQPWYA